MIAANIFLFLLQNWNTIEQDLCSYHDLDKKGSFLPCTYQHIPSSCYILILAMLWDFDFSKLDTLQPNNSWPQVLYKEKKTGNVVGQARS